MSEESPPLTVMLVDDEPARAAMLERALADSGFVVVGRLGPDDNLIERVADIQPDVTIVDLDSPSRDTLEDMATLNRDNPHPIVMFTAENDMNTMRAAMKNGVSAYIVDGLDVGRVRSIVDVAIARFREFHALRAELDQARCELEDRKLLDRAKGLLMANRQMTEDQAYSALRKMAMDRGQRIVDVARNVIEIMELMSGND